MNIYCRLQWSGMAAGLLAAGMSLVGPEAQAFPPAPHHLVYGQVRDEQGNPFHVGGAVVLLEVEGGSTVNATVSPGQAEGINYQLKIPLDMGALGNAYKPSALLPTVPFRIRVRVGSVTYLPLEMVGIGTLLTRPAEATRLDLTLGVDSDGDGLPDAWELALIQALKGDGQTRTLADIRPEDDSDGDGLSNLDEYYAGTYAFDPKDGFALEIIDVKDGRALLEFTAVRGRSYKLMGSPDAKEWKPLNFYLDTASGLSEELRFYYAEKVQRVRIWSATAAGIEPARFFRITTH